MSQSDVRRGLELRLAAMVGDLGIDNTAYENKTFVAVGGVPFQRLNLLPALPGDEFLTGTVFFDNGVFQITLCYPINVGSADAEAQAQLIRQQFKRGTSIVQNGISINITRTPRIAPAFLDGDRYCVPINVAYQAQTNVS